MKRRSFVHTTGLGAMALAFPNCLMSAPKAKKGIGVALVGLGYYSRDLLAPALQLTEHCHLAGIVTGSPEKNPVWQRKYDIPDANIYNYENMGDIANNPSIDVIYIVLPTGLHAKYAIKAAETGKHVWCEKPMARTVEECREIIDACNKNKVKLSIGYRMQHEPNTQTIMAWSKTKPFGKINQLLAEAGYNDQQSSNHWKLVKAMGGGAIYDMGVYPINAARYTTGEFPIAVTARHENKRDVYTEVNETTIFTLEFPSGAIANCKTSFGMHLNDLQVSCENGSYGLSPFQSYNGVKGSASDGTLLNKPIKNQQAKQMDDDALAIMNNTKVMVPGEDGLADIRIVEATLKSAELGKRVKI